MIPTAEPVDDPDLLPPQGQACAACGAPVEPLDQFCASCGRPAKAAADEVLEAEVLPQRFFRCKNCGSEVATDPDQRSYTCAFCESTYVVEFSPDETTRQRPEFVIGFSIPPEKAQQMFHQWLTNNRWFRPGDLQAAKIVERLRGVYMPFWSFSMLAQSSWSAEIGEYWYRTESYTTMENGKMVRKTRRVTETEWWQLAGRHHEYHSGHLVSGSQGLTQPEAQRVMPYQLAALKRYRPYFLAGWLSEEYSIQRDEALQRCKQVFYQREHGQVASFMPGDRHRNLHVSATFSHIQSDLILLPVYLLSYQYRDKQYRFLINGQTGRITGDKPVSHRRIAAVIGGTIAAIVVVVLLLLLIARVMS
jgi:hypothetical protein